MCFGQSQDGLKAQLRHLEPCAGHSRDGDEVVDGTIRGGPSQPT